MSSWETLSYKIVDGDTDSITRFASGDNEQVQQFLVGDKGPVFDGDTCWIPHEAAEAYLTRVNDTSDSGVIQAVFGYESWSVHRHEGSLWTADVHPGPSYEWGEDLLERVPNWVTVGGNWSHMDS